MKPWYESKKLRAAGLSILAITACAIAGVVDGELAVILNTIALGVYKMAQGIADSGKEAATIKAIADNAARRGEINIPVDAKGNIL